MSHALTGLNEEQQKVVLATYGPVLVLAGAGSGKTRALTHRIAHLVEQRIAAPDQILAVTFTNKAAAEMKHRISQLLRSSHISPQAVSTFHSMGVKILREQANFHTRSRGFSILDSKDSEKLVRKALKDANYSLKEWSPNSVKNMISRIKHEHVDIPVLTNAQSPAEEVLSVILPVYEKMLAEHNAYDFDDLLRIPLRILRSHESVRALYQSRWRFISVDEYQDTNPMQDEIIAHLLGPDRNLCVVGDDYQSIYSWRGANVDHILQFEQRHPGCTTILLTQNYRSTPNILEVANNVIAQNVSQKHKTLWTTQTTGSDVVTTQLPSDRGEAEWVCSQIREHVRNRGSLSNCAVLYRTNAQSRLMEEQFLMHRMPYTIVGGFRFYDRKEIKDALAILSFYLSPSSRIHFERIADALLARVGPKTIDRWDRAAREQGVSLGQYLSTTADRADLRAIFSAFRQAKQETHERVSDLLRFLVTKTGYLASLENIPDGKERTENINELFNVAAAYTTTEAFLEDTALLSDIDTQGKEDSRVTCMTLHASKGLEFPVVFIIGCEEGLLPHENSFSSSANLEEERRLMYVGITRAREKLTITHAAYRFRGGEMKAQSPSRFLEQLPASTSSYKENTFDTHYSESSDITDFLLDEPTLVQPTSGSYVTHPTFGRGVIIGISGETITCVFEGHGVKNVPATICSPQN
ncbi:MAG TPA: UvrD-helicase domain-containing protein [Candidatus Andersenbacteria bacterium]|nr:UvrD-helicase domain-containing protein [Candidatus Andersenbacteria bacterium]